ncbi:MAG: hypothetical protein NTW21_33545 [Verrucomicrobia bacterium]|nr:hypothetical protein [Verrucomicrobiota bacterium]
MSNQHASTTLVGLEEGRKSVFGTSPEAPSKRTFAEWKARGFFPFVKIGKRVFVDPSEVRRALDRRFKINAVAVR